MCDNVYSVTYVHEFLSCYDMVAHVHLMIRMACVIVCTQMRCDSTLGLVGLMKRTDDTELLEHR